MTSLGPAASALRRRGRGAWRGAVRAVVHPRGFQRVTGVVDSVADHVAELGEPWRYERLRDAEEVRRPPARTTGPPHAAMEALSVHRHPAVFRARLPGARIAGSQPLVLTADRRALLESTFDREQLEANPVMRRRLHPARRRSGPHVVLVSQWAGSYFHWMLDTLPRLALLEESDVRELPLVVPADPGPAIGDTLRALGVPAERLAPHDGMHLVYDELVFPSLVGATGHPPAWALQWLRERLVPRTAGHGRRLYVSRADATWRRVRNEDEIVAVLRERGFETVLPGRMPVADQLALFAEAEAVVGPHGAGLVNLLAATGAKVLELLPETWVNGCYYALSASVGLDYSYLVTPSAGRHDLRVDASALRAALDAAGF